MSEKRLAVVTGAARGIGRAIVLELLKQGRIVAGLDINAGAEYIDAECVVDGNLITSRKPDDLPAFCTAILKALEK